MPFTPPDLHSTLGVLSAMITPAVLILATGSLILTTTNRLVRVVDRVRVMLPEFEAQAEHEPTDAIALERRTMMFAQLDRATVRARLIQRALTRLYLALGVSGGDPRCRGQVRTRRHHRQQRGHQHP